MQGIRIHWGHIIRQQSPSLKLGGRFLSSQSFVSAQSTTCSYRSSVTPYYRVLHHSWSNPHLLRTPPHHGAVSLIIASTRGHLGEPIGKRRCQHKNPMFVMCIFHFPSDFSGAPSAHISTPCMVCGVTTGHLSLSCAESYYV